MCTLYGNMPLGFLPKSNVARIIVRHKINLTWNCGIKFFSLQIPVC